jgi:hypothetical protein
MDAAGISFAGRTLGAAVIEMGPREAMEHWRG